MATWHDALITVRLCIAAFAALASTPPAAAQPAGDAPRPVRVVLASARISLNDGAPQHFKLLRVELRAGAPAASFNGDAGLLFVVAGSAEVVAGDGRAKTLEENEGFYLPPGRATLRTAGNRPATLLHYLLVPSGRLASTTYAPDAGVTELYRSADPIPGLGTGPHELSLTRVSSSPGTPAPPMHQRSAAALYMLLSGTGVMHLTDRDERREAGTVVYEPNGLMHTWENVGKVPLVFLQANISREGVPEILWAR